MYTKLKNLSSELESYKKAHGLIDYNDMILDFIKSDASPPFDVVFIDEAHTLIGAGGAEGQNDAANLLKPALGTG